MKPHRDPGSAGGLAGRVVAADDEERRRIAREIHDDFGQRLTALALALKVVRKKLPETDPQLPELDAIGGSLAELGEDLRRLSRDLHPTLLERRGLAEALRDLCAEMERRHGLQVELSPAGGEDAFPPDIALGLYRIAQEALGNTARHAGARTARVSLRTTARTASLSIVDDGAGFDPEAAWHAGGMGLASIEERAQLLGGRCRIASTPAGTEIDVAVPLPAQGAFARPADFVRRHRVLVTSAALLVLALTAAALFLPRPRPS